MHSSTRDTIVNALGTARMAPYLSAVEGNKKRALTLYRWSVELTAAIQETLGITEVILRNAIDNQWQRWNDNEKGSPTSWLLHEPARPLLSLTQGKRLEAQKRARKSADLRPDNHPRSGQAITHDDVLAHTMFGMWKDILPNHGLNADPNKIENRNRRRLWGEAIEMALPLADDPTGETTYWRVTHLHGLRNRVSHMDSLLNVDVIDIINDAFALVGSVDPALVDWITGTSTVRSVHSRRPK